MFVITETPDTCLEVEAGELILSGNYPNVYSNVEDNCWIFTAEENQVSKSLSI